MRYMLIEPGNEVVGALLAYRKIALKLLKGSATEQELEAAYDRLMCALRAVGQLDQFTSYVDIDDGEMFADEAFISHEVNVVASTLGKSKNYAYKVVISTRSDPHEVVASEQIVQAFSQSHAIFLANYRNSLAEQRKAKKARRKQLRSALELMVGGGVIAAFNTLSIAVNPLVRESYALGAGMVIKGAYDMRRA